MAEFEELAKAAGWIKRTRKQHSLHGTPRVGQVFWVDFPADAMRRNLKMNIPEL
jgi:hypothetical protein